MSASVFQKVEAVWPGFHRQVLFSDLQDMQLYQLEKAVRAAGASHCQSIVKQDGGMDVSATQTPRATVCRPFVLSLSTPEVAGPWPVSEGCQQPWDQGGPALHFPSPGCACEAPRWRNGSRLACRLPKTRQRLGNESPGSTSRRICLWGSHKQTNICGPL